MTHPPSDPAAEAVTPAVLAAAWGAWRIRHKDKIGPGPAFKEAITAGMAVALAPLLADRDRLATELAEARAEVADLREALVGLDQRILTDPQEIERAGEWRTFIARALTTAKGDADGKA